MKSCILLTVLPLLTVNGFLLFSDNREQVLNTRLGEIHGFLEDVVFDNKRYQVKKFLGIPYAEPPVGEFRFRKPSPLRVFPSPLNATSYGPMCPQPSNGKQRVDEDCLYLNVFVPSSTSAHAPKKQVMVWIHGGAFAFGSGNIKKFDVLSAFTDVIIVTINYRLGALGFFTTNDLEGPGNYGLWDQHQALRWVHDNIEAFGGNPENITIFGESAGSSSVVFQATFPGNRGLFKRVIAESGTIAGWGVIPYNELYNHSMDFAKGVGCPTENHAHLMDCLRGKASDEIASVSTKFAAFGFPFPSWVPTYDNDFLPVDPVTLFNDKKLQDKYLGYYRDTDFMIGWNSLDSLVYLYYWGTQFNITSVDNFTITKSQFESYYIPNVAKEALQVVPTDSVEAAVKQEYTDFDDPNNGDKLVKIVADMATDALLVAPSILAASTHASNTSATYVYRFAAKRPIPNTGIPAALDGPEAANHADELMYVYGFDGTLSNYIDDPAKRPPVTVDQVKLSKTMMRMWSNFARTGNPNTPIDVKGLFDVEWQPFTETSPDYIELTVNMTQSSVKSSKNLSGVDLWNNRLPALQKRG